MPLNLLATGQSATAAGTVLATVFLAAMVIAIATWILIFVRARQPWWAALVPFLSGAVMLQILGRPVWWLALVCIPGVDLIPLAVLAFDTAKAFGKKRSFGLGLLLFPPGFLLALDVQLLLGRARCEGPLTGRAPILQR